MKQRICRFAVDSRGAHAPPGPLKKGHRIAVALFCCSILKNGTEIAREASASLGYTGSGGVVTEQVGLTSRDAYVSEMGNPIAQIDVNRMLDANPMGWGGKGVVHGRVPMTEEEAIDFRIGFAEVLRRVLPEPLGFWGVISRNMGTGLSAVGRPPAGKPMRPIWVDLLEKHLEESVVEQAFEPLVRPVSGSESIAVADVATQPIPFPDHGSGMYPHTQFLLQIAEGPEIVVARVEMDGQSLVCQPGDGAHQTAASPRYHVVVFVPKVEQVAHEVDFSRGETNGMAGSSRSLFQPLDEKSFPCSA